MKTSRVSALLFSAALLPAQAATYKEAGGVVVVEAEHFDARTANTDGHHWAVMPDENGDPDTAADAGFANARGGKYVKLLPDSAGGGSAYNTTAQVGIDPHLDFKVKISTTGSYRLWLRWGGYDGSSDSATFCLHFASHQGIPFLSSPLHHTSSAHSFVPGECDDLNH